MLVYRAVLQTTVGLAYMWPLHLRVSEGVQAVQRQLAATQERTQLVEDRAVHEGQPFFNMDSPLGLEPEYEKLR
jgi:hypothetical protein